MCQSICVHSYYREKKKYKQVTIKGSNTTGKSHKQTPTLWAFDPGRLNDRRISRHCQWSCALATTMLTSAQAISMTKNGVPCMPIYEIRHIPRTTSQLNNPGWLLGNLHREKLVTFIIKHQKPRRYPLVAWNTAPVEYNPSVLTFISHEEQALFLVSIQHSSRHFLTIIQCELLLYLAFWWSQGHTPFYDNMVPLTKPSFWLKIPTIQPQKHLIS